MFFFHKVQGCSMEKSTVMKLFVIGFVPQLIPEGNDYIFT